MKKGTAPKVAEQILAMSQKGQDLPPLDQIVQAVEIVDEEEQIRNTFKKDKQKGSYDLAVYLTKKYDIVTIGEKEREVYVYQNGMYTRAENLILYPEMQRVLGNLTTKQGKGETFSKITDMTHHDRNIFTSADVNYIPLKNGVYDLQKDKLLPHSSEYRFKFQFPVEYNSTATCPKIEAFLDQVLTEEQRQTIEEWIGYYFYRNYMFKKALIMVGPGDSGKTTLLQVINRLLGLQNISAVSLHKIGSDKFAAAHLYEKHGNIVDELEKEDVTRTGNFKIATGGGTITGEYKFGNQFSFESYAKFTFACNQIPDVEDFDDEAYFNRWMVIRFGKTIENKILNFAQTLTTEEEISGLFNLAMRGLTRLLHNKKFTYSSTAMDTKLEMMRSGTSIARFVKDRLQKEPGGTMTNEEMYEAYSSYCELHDLMPETITAIGSRLIMYASYISKAQVYGLRNGNTVQVRGWRNVSLIPSEDELKEREEIDGMLKQTSDILEKRAKLVVKPV